MHHPATAANGTLDHVHLRTRCPLLRYDVVGPASEIGDTFAVGREMPAYEAADLLIIASAGAYGAAMASMYNSRPLLAEVLVDGNRYAIVRHRQAYDKMMHGEQLAQRWYGA